MAAAKAKVRRGKPCRHCKNVARSRDVCWSCGNVGNEAIKRGETTDEALVAEGYWAPRKDRGRRAGEAGRRAIERIISTRSNDCKSKKLSKVS